jgi:FtsH-binding integral membrane protein
MDQTATKNTNEEKSAAQEQEHVPAKHRPLGLSVLLIFSFIYNGLLLLVMTMGLFSTEVVRNILQQYYTQIYISDIAAFMLTFTGSLIFGISFYGLIMLWKMRRKGFYYYATAQAFMIVSLIVFFRSYDYINIAIAFAVILIIGLHTRQMK